MRRQPPSSTRTDTPFPYPTLFRSRRFEGQRVAVVTGDAQLHRHDRRHGLVVGVERAQGLFDLQRHCPFRNGLRRGLRPPRRPPKLAACAIDRHLPPPWLDATSSRCARWADTRRSEAHTSELQSLMRISYAVFCLKKKNTTTHKLDPQRT